MSQNILMPILKGTPRRIAHASLSQVLNRGEKILRKQLSRKVIDLSFATLVLIQVKVYENKNSKILCTLESKQEDVIDEKILDEFWKNVDGNVSKIQAASD